MIRQQHIYTPRKQACSPPQAFTMWIHTHRSMSKLLQTHSGRILNAARLAPKLRNQEDSSRGRPSARLTVDSALHYGYYPGPHLPRRQHVLDGSWRSMLLRYSHAERDLGRTLPRRVVCLGRHGWFRGHESYARIVEHLHCK